MVTLYTFFVLSIDIPSVKKKLKTPAPNKTVVVASKCVIPLEPLVFNGNSGTPVKRRASRSIPDESSVTTKKSRHNQSAKKTEGPVNSPRRRYSMNYDTCALYIQLCTLHHSRYLGQKIWQKMPRVKNPEKPTYLTQQIDEKFLKISVFVLQNLVKVSFNPGLY